MVQHPLPTVTHTFFLASENNIATPILLRLGSSHLACLKLDFLLRPCRVRRNYD